MANKKQPKVAKSSKIDTKTDNTKDKAKKPEKDNKGYAWAMSYAPTLNEDTHWFQMIPLILFGAFSILLVRMYSYTRPMDQFYWSGGNNDLSDFFSHCKMVCIMIAAALTITVLLYRLCTQTLAIKKSYAYIPMAVYAVMVIISYLCSDYKEFALWGYNDRFEGTMTLLAYMIMLFAIINLVNTEKNVKTVLYPIFASSAILGLLGLSQGLDHDFFRTRLGQKLITPNTMTDSGVTIHQMVDQYADQGQQLLSFTFQNKEIYQTVYNINYVSFYLTLLLPLVGLLFIRSVERIKEDGKWQPIVWGLLFALLLYNLIGSESSGGFFGMAVVVLLAFIVLNKKILRWWKPVAVLLVITVIIGGLTFDRWGSEITGTFNGLSASEAATSEEADTSALTGHLDYFDTDSDVIKMSMNGVELSISANSTDGVLRITDANGERVGMQMVGTDTALYSIDNEAFKNVTIQPAVDESNNLYVLINTNNPKEYQWTFAVTDEGILYRNDYGTLIDLDPIPSIGFENNASFGSGRGYIWSRTLPMMKNTFFVGHGADTYCLFFPHSDYVGKYNSGTFTRNVDIIVDKPHDMYMCAWVGTGGLSVLALIALWGIYIVQSILIYIRRDFSDMTFMDLAGVGMALGITGFVFTGLVDDSTVSVMPIFYVLLGMGIVINSIQKKQKNA